MNRRTATACLLALAAALTTFAALAPSAPAADAANAWPQWRGPTRDGISTEKGFATSFPAEGPKIDWKADVGEGYASFAVADGKVLTAGDVKGKDTVWCFDADSGKELWKHAIDKSDDPHACPTPAIDNGKVYAFVSGNFLCLNLADGKLLWSKNVQKDFGAPKPQYGFTNSPLLLGNAVILDAGTNIALDKTTGELLWKSPGGEPSYGSPVPFKSGAKTLLATFKPSGLVVIDSEGGAKVASFEWRTSYNVNAATPICFDDNKIFISSGYGHGCALVKLSGDSLAKVYENKEMQNQYTSSVYYNGYIYGQSDGGNLRCLDANTGKTKWSHGGFGAGGLTLADGKLIIMADGGTFALVDADPAAFKPLASAKILTGKCWTAPTLANGRVYCRSYAGNIVCVDLRAK